MLPCVRWGLAQPRPSKRPKTLTGYRAEYLRGTRHPPYILLEDPTVRVLRRSGRLRVLMTQNSQVLGTFGRRPELSLTPVDTACAPFAALSNHQTVCPGSSRRMSQRCGFEHHEGNHNRFGTSGQNCQADDASTTLSET